MINLGEIFGDADVTGRLLLALSLSLALVVIVAELISRIISRPLWRRVIWQVAVLSLLCVFALEVSGLGVAVLQLAPHHDDHAKCGWCTDDKHEC